MIQDNLRALRELLADTPQGSAREVTKGQESQGTDTESAGIRQELEELRKTMADYKAREQKSRLAQQPMRDIDFTLDVADDPVKGSADARLTLVEFTDFQCPFCARHQKNVMPKLLKNYVDTGKIRYVLRDYPLGFHQHAAKANESAQCARDRGKYWEMSDQLFDNQRALMKDKLAGYAEAAGVPDIAAFNTCLDSDRFAERTKRSLAEGVKAGVSGTQSFLLGIEEVGSKSVKATKFIRGAQPYEMFEDAIKALLSLEQG